MYQIIKCIYNFQIAIVLSSLPVTTHSISPNTSTQEIGPVGPWRGKGGERGHIRTHVVHTLSHTYDKHISHTPPTLHPTLTLHPHTPPPHSTHTTTSTLHSHHHLHTPLTPPPPHSTHTPPPHHLCTPSSHSILTLHSHTTFALHPHTPPSHT